MTHEKTYLQSVATKVRLELACQGGHWSGKSQGNLIFLQGQGKVRILQIGQGNFKYQESQGKVGKFHNSGPRYVL